MWCRYSIGRGRLFWYSTSRYGVALPYGTVTVSLIQLSFRPRPCSCISTESRWERPERLLLFISTNHISKTLRFSMKTGIRMEPGSSIVRTSGVLMAHWHWTKTRRSGGGWWDETSSLRCTFVLSYNYLTCIAMYSLRAKEALWHATWSMSQCDPCPLTKQSLNQGDLDVIDRIRSKPDMISRTTDHGPWCDVAIDAADWPAFHLQRCSFPGWLAVSLEYHPWKMLDSFIHGPDGFGILLMMMSCIVQVEVKVR